MRIIKQSAEIIQPKPTIDLYESITNAGKVCYRSENTGDYANFIHKIIDNGHGSVLEHESISVEMITDRGVLAELTRHRIASYSVESTRYVRYKESDDFKVIEPINITEEAKDDWKQAMLATEIAYNEMLKKGCSPQIARSVLPQCFATKIRMTANIRSWRGIFIQRLSKAAHPQIRDLMNTIYNLFIELYPLLFEDIKGSK
jgi:thymidylate synthase (FAD)